MNVNTQELRRLRDQVARKAHLEAQQKELQAQKNALMDKTAALKAAFLTEQEDVDRLEGKTLAAMFYDLIGKKDDKLAKEKKEAYAARVKYDTAAQELDSVEFRLRSIGEELLTLRECEGQYEKELSRVLDEIKAGGDPRSEAVLKLEERIADRQRDKKELSEAIAAGNSAMQAVDAVLRHLDDAEGWGTWDIFGGGLLADIAKHDALESAQRAVDLLQVRLRSFKTELVDVAMEVNVQITIDGFLGFADWFFDGFFADFAVMDKIEQSARDVQSVKSELQSAIHTLRQKYEKAMVDEENAKKRLADLAIG